MQFEKHSEKQLNALICAAFLQYPTSRFSALVDRVDSSSVPEDLRSLISAVLDQGLDVNATHEYARASLVAALTKVDHSPLWSTFIDRTEEALFPAIDYQFVEAVKYIIQVAPRVSRLAIMPPSLTDMAYLKATA